jgi:biopolymer transport protein TolR
MAARGHRGNLESIGHELNLVPYLDIMVNLVLFMLVTITSFLSFTMLNASIPLLAPDTGQAAETMKKEELLLMVRVTKEGFLVDPNIQGGRKMNAQHIAKQGGQFNFDVLRKIAGEVKAPFPNETRVLIAAEPGIIYDDIIRTMDSLRETVPGREDLFPDVTLSVLQ